jgi:hypothetical protein
MSGRGHGDVYAHDEPSSPYQARDFALDRGRAFRPPPRDVAALVAGFRCSAMLAYAYLRK